jgi:arylsulfatase A-like enzyme
MAVWSVVSLSAGERSANVLIISVDTLRSDRLSGYGYERQTSPNIDSLLDRGVRFTEARTVEPLTAPALASMLISMPPHEHGSTRNGLGVRPDTPSLPRVLRRQGYRTAAFVGSWTLRKNLWEMNDHFDTYEAVLTKSRWMGVWTREAKAEDLNRSSLEWLAGHLEVEGKRPFFLWVHYVEPHTPYVLQEDFLDQIGPAPDGDLKSKSYRYDSEIAYVDDQIGQLLAGVGELVALDDTLIIFVSDHGESLGEHDYWGHGRNLFEPNLKIPLGLVFAGRVAPGVEEAPALITDIAPTVVGLLGFRVPDFYQGLNWAPVFGGETPSPIDRVTLYETHKGAVRPYEGKDQLRQKGLLEVGRLAGTKKELYRLKGETRQEFDLGGDAAELESLVASDSALSVPLQEWLSRVRKGLVLSDDLPPPSLSEEDTEALRALGYLD